MKYKSRMRYMNTVYLKKFKYPILFALVIIVIAAFFHYPLHIENALTGETAQEFSIHISTFRVTLEPLFGPLLYSLRADQPIQQFGMLMIWAIFFFLLFSIIKGVIRKQIGGEILLWLLKTPVIIAVFLFFLIVLIFMPLPSNKILNNSHNKILLNTHSHTEWSHDGLITQEELMEWHKRNGFDAFFITDHNHHLKTLEAIQKQKEGKLPDTPFIIAGQEFSGSNHITILGLERNFTTRGLPDSVVIDSAHANNGVAIVAHWFKGERNSLQFYINKNVDGFEIVNQAKGLSYNRNTFRSIVKACKTNGLIMNGAIDYHGYGATCFVWNAMEIPGWHKMDYGAKRESIMNILRNRNVSKIETLIYKDREVYSRSYLMLSPLYNFYGYFRSLNFWQLLSWLLWLILLIYLKTGYFETSPRFRGKSAFVWFEVEAISSFTILLQGIILLNKVEKVSGFNKIYSEYGEIMLYSGIGFLLYSALFFIIIKKILLNKSRNVY